MTVNTKITGLIQLITPMHVASTDVVSLDANNYVISGKNGNPLTGTMKQAIAVDGFVQHIPYFPSNDLRGRLRRKAAAIILKAFKAKKITVPAAIYSGLMCGSASANPENNLSIEEAVRGAKHVYMGVFGGGTRILESGYAPWDMVPILKCLIDIGMIPKHFSPSEKDVVHKSVTRNDGETTVIPMPDANRLLDVRHIVRIDDIDRVWDCESLCSYIDGGVSAIIEHQTGVKEENTNRKADKIEGVEKKKTTLANIVSVQSIIPGTMMYAHIDLADRLSDAQIGLLITALLDLINEQELGGIVRMGFGRFRATDFNLSRAGQQYPLFEQDNDGTYKLTEKTKKFTEAMAAEVDQETLESISLFFTPTALVKVSKKDKPAKATETN